MTELERMAREVLAHEWEARGCVGFASDIRTKDIEQVAVRAIMTALTKAPPGWRLVPEQLTEAMDVAAYLDEQDPNAGPSTIWRAFLAAAPEYKEGER